jgi:hypothetical protein
MSAVCALLCAAAMAHRAPTSVVRLEFGVDVVHAEVLVPRSELAYALPASRDDSRFTAYLLKHLAAETPDGARWRIHVRGMREATYADHEYLRADLDLTPPRGASPRHFVLINDAVTHEVRNHVVWVIDTASHELLGALQYPVSRLPIDRSAAR